MPDEREAAPAAPAEPAAPVWHAQPPEAVLHAFGSGAHGLSEAAARERLERDGPNRLPEPPRRGVLQRLGVQFHNLLIYILLAAAVVTLLLDHLLDTAVILGVVLINALIGFVQEGRAEQAMRAIRQMLSPQATVLREGRPQTLSAETLVRGDLVLLQSGDRVPADLRLIETHNLQVQEAVLAGESVPVDKMLPVVPEHAALGDRFCMAYSGTLVTRGQARGVVVATGAATEIGRISGLLAQVQTLQTPLLQQIARFSRWLAGAILLVAVIGFAYGVGLRGYALDEMFLVVVGMVVAAIPEGLPAIITITLALGVQAMARGHAIVRRLPAVETLGAVTVICSDKTGTLTRNEMLVQSLCAAGGEVAVDGVGYAPVGALSREGRVLDQPLAEPVLAALADAALLCNDASLRRENGEWQPVGDPTEAALCAFAGKVGLDLEQRRLALPRADVIPFESEQRFMATLHHDHAGAAWVLVKGAPERLLEMCEHELAAHGERPLDVAYWREAAERLASRGQRVLAAARRELPPGRCALESAAVQQGLTFLGLYGLIDPPREEAREAISACRAAGIRVKMITGDHALTARAIAAQLGLGERPQVLTGQALDGLDDGELAERALEVDVFARTSPEHKLRLVQALQARGQVVAMTGDGVNDAPALKRADVGIAMGRKGTEAAKEAAEVVLADDNFATIAVAVRSGRTIYDNIRKAIFFILPTNGGEALVILGAVLAGMALPVAPVQILWVNMVTAVTLALAVAFESAEPDIMRRPPRPRGQSLLSRLLVWRVVLVSVLLLAITTGTFLAARYWGFGLEAARTAAVNALVLGEIAYLFNARRMGAGVLGGGLRATPAVWTSVILVLALQLAFTYAPPLQLLFATEPLPLLPWLWGAALAGLLLVVVELDKMSAVWRRRRAR